MSKLRCLWVLFDSPTLANVILVFRRRLPSTPENNSNLAFNSLTTLPEGVFQGLTALEYM